MILIMSQFEDHSTISVTQWLLHYNIPFVRVDLQKKYFLKRICIANNDFDFAVSDKEGTTFSMNDVKAVWYRRGIMDIDVPKLNVEMDGYVKSKITRYLYEEKAVMEDFFYLLMKKKPHIGTFDRRAMNKLEVLYEASLLDIEIPTTLITTEKKDARGYFEGDIITKSIYEGFKIEMDDIGRYTTYTERIPKDTLLDNFFPSLFQSEIGKEADIRSFYLDGEFYTMAIRSQCDDQTVTDFRKYIKGRDGNRLFPFQLPKELEEKLHQLMINVGLSTGSLDLVFTKDGRFVFLEVNPVGQFGMTSHPCNYYLEKAIANKLISFSKN